MSCYQVFVGARLHVTGGALRGGRAIEGEAAVAGIFGFSFYGSSIKKSIMN